MFFFFKGVLFEIVGPPIKLDFCSIIRYFFPFIVVS